MAGVDNTLLAYFPPPVYNFFDRTNANGGSRNSGGGCYEKVHHHSGFF